MSASVLSKEEDVILSMLHGLWLNRCLSVVVAFKIPEILCNSDAPSVSIEDIATKTGCTSSEQIYLMMRLLAQWGIGKELENKHFAKNNGMEHLRMDKGPSLGHMVNYFCCDEYFNAMRYLPQAMRSNQSAFTLEHGMKDIFQYMNQIDVSTYDKDKQFEGSSSSMIGSDERRREFADFYHQAMAIHSQLSLLSDVKGIPSVYDAFPWSRCKRLLDVGGSYGTFLASILKQPDCQHIQGFVADLPAVVDEALQNYDQLGIPEKRITFLKQDVTQPFPEDFQVDTILFKVTLVIFDTETKIKILRNCRSILPKEGGKILVLSSWVTDAGVSHKNVGINGLQHGISALHVGFMFNGVVKTKSESEEYFNEVGNQAGFRLSKIYDTFLGGYTIFELSCIQ